MYLSAGRDARAHKYAAQYHEKQLFDLENKLGAYKNAGFDVALAAKSIHNIGLGIHKKALEDGPVKYKSRTDKELRADKNAL